MKSQDWIRIEDKKPPYGKRVLVCRAIGEECFVFVAKLLKVGDHPKWYDDEGWDWERVTHWMPIVHPKQRRKRNERNSMDTR